MKSRYDEIHDYYHQIASGKPGTRYEILAAFVLKALEAEGAVVHDLKVRGGSDISHQIDVVVGHRGAKKHMLVECKDYDESGKKVGLARVRDFWGVVDDVRPDDALIVTTTGFTRPAEKYARHKRIRTAILREATEEEKGPGIAVVTLSIQLSALEHLRTDFGVGSQAAGEALGAAFLRLGVEPGRARNFEHLPVFLRIGQEQERFDDFLDRRRAVLGSSNVGENSFRESLTDAWLVVGSSEPISLNSYCHSYVILDMPPATLKMRGREVAMLVLDEPAGKARQFTDVELEGLKRESATGEIQRR